MLIDATSTLVGYDDSRPAIYDPSAVPPLKAENLAARFLVGYTNGATRRAYQANLRDWFAWCLEHQLDPLAAKREHVSLYMNALLEDGNMASTVNRKLTAMASFYTWCVDDEELVRNPVKAVRRPPIPTETSREWMTGFEVARCLQVAENEGGYTYALICLLSMNALRIGAVIAARMEDVTSDKHHTVLRVRTKNSQVYRTAIPPRTVWALNEAHQGRTNGPLILSGRQAGLTRDSAGRTCRRVAKYAGIKKNITPHSFRHSAISLALADGVDIRTVQRDLAHHVKSDTTEGYAHDAMPLDKSVSYTLAGSLASRMW